MKKLLTIVLTVCLLVCALAVPTYAGTTISGSATNTGNQVVVTFSYAGEFTTYGVYVNYDHAALELVSFSNGGFSGLFAPNVAESFVAGTSMTSTTGVMFTAVFNKLTCGQTTVSLTVDEFKNARSVGGQSVVDNIDITSASVNVQLDHVWQWQQTKAPTHTETGWMSGRCSICGGTTGYALDTIAHDFTGEWLSDETGHWHECECGALEETQEHTMVWVVDKEAQVGVEGSQHEECEICGYEGATEKIPALIDPAPTPDPEPDPEPTPSRSYDGLLIAIGCIIILLLLAILIVLLKKKRR